MVSFIFRKKRYTVSFFAHLWDNKEHKSVIVSFPFEKEYTIADKEVCRMKAYAAGKLFWNTFKCESVLLRERCCNRQVHREYQL